MSVLFNSLTPLQKVDFFVKCQELLVAYHPESPFIYREDNVEDRMPFFTTFQKRYKGFTHSNDYLCILYNTLYIKDPRDPIREIKSNMFKEPAQPFNCYMIDWVVFRKLEDIGQFVEENYKPEIKWVAWAKNNDIKLYETGKLLESLNRLKQIPKLIPNY